jgi:hypothetical protein
MRLNFSLPGSDCILRFFDLISYVSEFNILNFFVILETFQISHLEKWQFVFVLNKTFFSSFSSSYSIDSANLKCSASRRGSLYNYADYCRKTSECSDTIQISKLSGIHNRSFNSKKVMCLLNQKKIVF